MRDWVAPETGYSIGEDGRVYAESPSVRKITGTSMGALIGVNPYETPFTASARLLGLWDEDIGDRPAVRTGRLLEERIIDYVSARHPDKGLFLKASDLYAPREGAHKDWKGDFDDEDFSGHVDGIVSGDGGDCILEVKTVRDLSAWADGVPPHYLWQVYLYNYFLTRSDHAYFAVGIVTAETYKDPYQWVPCRENCLLLEVPIDMDAVARVIGEARALRADMVSEGRTLPMDPSSPKDVELATHLADIQADGAAMADMASRYEAAMRRIDEAEARIKDARDEAETLKARLKDMMLANGVARCANMALSATTRKTFDFAGAEEAGIDIKPFTTTTTTYALRRMKR